VIEAADGRTVSFAELLERAGRIATLLKASGVGPGDRVAVQVEKSVSTVALYLAVLQVGAVYVPLNTGYTAAEVVYFLGDAEPKALVCEPEAHGGWRRWRPGSHGSSPSGRPGRGRSSRRRRGSPRSARLPGGAATTWRRSFTPRGPPGGRGAMLTNDNLWSNVSTLRAAWGFRPDDVLIHALPLYHTHGLFVALNLMLLNGGKLILLPKFEPERLIGPMRWATVLMGVPTFCARLLGSERLTREAAAGMRLFVSGSAPLLAATHAEFEARTGHRILERYGMTETGMNTSKPARRRAAAGDSRAGAAGRRGPGARCGRGAARAGRGRGARGARTERVQGLLADAGEDRRGDDARRLFRHRRHGGDRGGRPRRDRRAGEGPDHLGRAKCLSEGSRARDRRAALRRRERGDRCAAP